MVEITNIVINGNTISCNYDPEKSGKLGIISVDIETEEIIAINYSDYEYGKKMYAAHVRSKLIEALKSKKEIPSVLKAVWY